MKYTDGFIRVESVIDNLGDDGLTESTERCDDTRPARIGEDKEKVIALYTEEGQGGRTDTRVTISEGEITVSRTGAITSIFVYKEGEVTESLYRIGSFAFDASIKTRKIRNNLTRPYGSVHILYDMTVGGAKKAVRMKITLREAD